MENIKNSYNLLIDEDNWFNSKYIGQKITGTFKGQRLIFSSKRTTNTYFLLAMEDDEWAMFLCR